MLHYAQNPLMPRLLLLWRQILMREVRHLAIRLTA